MATEIKLPSLGEGVESGDVLEVLVSVGDTIEVEQGMIEIETDKATVIVPSPSAGKVVSIAVGEGDTVEVGGLILTMEASAAESKPEPSVEPPAQEKPPAASESAAPSQAAPPAAPPSTPAPAAAAPAPSAAPAPAPPAAIVPQIPAASTAPVSAAPAIAPASAASGSDLLIPAGPAMRRFAREVGVDLSNVTGTGDGGRITREDILAVVRSASTRSSAVPANSASPSSQQGSVAASGAAGSDAANSRPGTAANDDYGPIRVERMSKIRKTIGAQMNKSWTTVPRVTNFDDADITELEVFRQASKGDYASRGLKLTTMPFLIKAVATALMNHPAINATVDAENEQLIYKDYVNLGIAVDTDRGLVVPTLKNAHQLSIPGIAAALADLAGRVRDNNFGMADLRGGTFTISNLGAIGGTYSTPIVNVPEVAILLVGRSRKLPVVMPDDTIEPRLMMPLSISYDHRLVDGATAARFLNDVIGYLEAPSRLLLAV